MITGKNLALLFCVSLTCMLFVSCSSSEKDKKVLYDNALQYVKQDKIDAAILELRSAIQVDAKFADARYQLGLLYLKKGDLKKAFGELVRAADLDPANLEASLKVAYFYLLAQKKDECRHYLDKVLAKEPTNRKALTLLANLELMEGNHDKAFAALDKIGQAAENSDELLNIKGRIYASQKQFDKAEDAFRKAIAANNANFVNYETLLALLQQKNDLDKIKALLDEIVTKFPKNVRSHLLLADFYSKTREIGKTENELNEVKNLEPKNARFRLQLAEFYNRTGKAQKSLETLITAHADLPTEEDISAQLANQYLDRKDYDKASNVLNELKAKKPDSQNVKLIEARFLLKDRKIQDALAIFQKLSTDSPEWPLPHFYLGLTQYALGNIDLAQQSVLEAMQKDKNNPQYHAFLAQLYLMQNAFDNAKKEATIALSLNPHNVRTALILAKALIGTKQYKEALPILVAMKKQIADNQEVLSTMYLAHLGLGEKGKAEEVLKQLLVLDPGNAWTVSNYLQLKYANNLQGAVTFVSDQIKKSSSPGSTLYVILGALFEKQGSDQKALETYEKALELNTNDSAPYLASARLLLKLGKKTEALNRYTKMLEKNPKSIPGLMGTASIYLTSGENDKAVNEYRKILAIKEDFAPAANNLAWLLASDPKGDRGEALRLAMVAKQAFPKDPNIADTLGWVHYNRNSYALAIGQFEQALQNQPDNPTLNYHLALARKGNNEKEAAAQSLKKALESKGAFPERQDAEKLLKELSTK